MRFAQVALLLALAGISSHAGDWPNYRGPKHDGTSPEKIAQFPAGGPRQLWKVATPSGFSSFVVSGGRAFIQVMREVEGVNRDVLLCLDAESGKELWSQVLGVAKYGDGGDDGADNNQGGDGPRSTPAVDGDKAYLLSTDLMLSCFDAASGRKLWNKDILKEHSGRNISWKNAASPVIEGDLIFVAGGGEGQALLGIDKNTGKTVWKGEDDKMTHATPVPTTIHGLRQVIFFTQKGLVAVKPDNGQVLWRQKYQFSTSTAASPVVFGNIVYCSAGYGVGAGAYEISKNGEKWEAKELWRTTGNKLANHWSTPIEKDGYLYGMFQFKEYDDGPVKCVEIKSGKEMWSQKGFGPGNVTMVGDQLIALTDDGEVVVIDPKPDAYKEVARFQAITGKCWSTPTFANERIYVRSTKEGACFDAGSRLTAK
jgi:outer membrane protein assembly factor BamB